MLANPTDISTQLHMEWHWRIQGGAGGAPPPIFGKYLKSLLNWLKCTEKVLGASPPKPRMPPWLTVKIF